MSNMVPTVYVVDDDPSFCRAVERLLLGLGYRAEAYAVPGEFMAHWRPDDPGCVILDLRMPELPGLEVQRLVSASEPAHARDLRERRRPTWRAASRRCGAAPRTSC